MILFSVPRQSYQKCQIKYRGLFDAFLSYKYNFSSPKGPIYREIFEAYMALKGNLRDFTITQLFNLVNVARKTGTLVLERPNEKVAGFFFRGKDRLCSKWSRREQPDCSIIPG